MERTVAVVPEAGLHARPASKFVQTVNQYDATVTVGRADDGDDGMVDANSMLAVTGLNVEHGESVRIVAEGADASEALDALETVLTTPVEEG
ncbi:HPr family phosphocarrier protein [Halomicroarcula sp. F13]|uniref:HPr family phosphocarrier protein n=1 Tax=Haloarcula rubra TaxID=2487747 RepID=A0AAW4PTP6_9EURY|nr:phosphocarrier protein HPr [Halomicroarcula rubra]MBX0324561.1 HPr family phosphocarrier protein [Halomicroarcula rubra]